MRRIALSCFAFVIFAARGAQSAEPDLILTGTITRADFETYREVPFRVPAGVWRVTVEFAYTGREQRTTIDLGVRDGARFLGWSGGNKNTFTVSATDATPSYLPGPIVPSEWALVLGVPNIRPGVRAEFTAKIYFGLHEPASLSEGRKWYRGDLHMHTAHSDGSCRSQSGASVPCPVFKTVETAAARGLDFIAVTDHNTASHWGALRELQPYFDRLLLIPGEEVTTFHGHANVFGAREAIDFRQPVNTILRQAADLGGIVSINHPASASGEDCMGCGWTWSDTDFSRVQAVEIVNGTRAAGIAFWQELLNRGFRMTAVGGSDDHRAESAGRPATVIFAGALRHSAILEALRAGHVFVDVEGSRDRMLELTSASATMVAAMGDSVRAPRGVSVPFALHAMNVRGARIEVIEDGKPFPLPGNTLAATDDYRLPFELQGDGARHWIRADVRSAAGELLLVGNPIYLNW